MSRSSKPGRPLRTPARILVYLGDSNPAYAFPEHNVVHRRVIKGAIGTPKSGTGCTLPSRMRSNIWLCHIPSAGCEKKDYITMNYHELTVFFDWVGPITIVAQSLFFDFRRNLGLGSQPMHWFWVVEISWSSNPVHRSRNQALILKKTENSICFTQGGRSGTG